MSNTYLISFYALELTTIYLSYFFRWHTPSSEQNHYHILFGYLPWFCSGYRSLGSIMKYCVPALMNVNLNTVTLLNVMHTCNFYNTNLKTVTLHILITYSLMHKCQKQSVIFHIRSTYIKPPFTRKFYSPMLLIPLPNQPMGLMYFNYWFKSFPTKPQIDF